MTAYVIDGKAIAAKVRSDVAADVATLKSQHGIAPGLAVVLVGDDPASQVYVRNKAAQTVEVRHALVRAQAARGHGRAGELLALVAKLNADPAVNGILVQLPLPKHIDADEVIEPIDPAKDVDGFHPINVGRLSIGEPGAGALHAARLHACSAQVGASRPAGSTPSWSAAPTSSASRWRSCCCARTARSPSRIRAPRICRPSCARADILVAAVGQPEMVHGDWIKPGAIVIDVGINRIAQARTARARSSATSTSPRRPKVAGAITPVPGGVGPMTIACLLKNTVEAAMMQRGLQALAA